MICKLTGFGRGECGAPMVTRTSRAGDLDVCPRCDGDAAYPTKVNPDFNKPWPRTADET